MNALEAYGMVMRPMTEADLELTRAWRNAAHVRTQMAFQAEITPEMHAVWWAGLDRPANCYWIFGREGVEMGIVHLKDIHRERQQAEAGVWTADPAMHGSPWPVLAVLTMMRHGFMHLGLQRLEAKMRADHAGILDFNRQLGYEPIAAPEDGFVRMAVTERQFLLATSKLRKAAERFGPAEIRIY
jgi:RimJ/RimL family protein N-acetyltransferase